MIRAATQSDLPWLKEHDRHIGEDELRESVRRGRILLAEQDGQIIGWLRWSLFWDEIPFMNMLYLLEGFRRQGLGRALVSRWEEDMRRQGHRRVMTSSQANEEGQHFYRRLGYQDAGALLLPGEPLEIIFLKELAP
ncbi:MAG: GNAT family N-acetyltransferase [Eubacteriales bacterium]|nr:GNAT family N-acetyltransferase [Eubacteriales bacterium]